MVCVCFDAQIAKYEAKLGLEKHSINHAIMAAGMEVRALGRSHLV